jgi:hypothetical protein
VEVSVHYTAALAEFNRSGHENAAWRGKYKGSIAAAPRGGSWRSDSEEANRRGTVAAVGSVRATTRARAASTACSGHATLLVTTPAASAAATTDAANHTPRISIVSILAQGTTIAAAASSRSIRDWLLPISSLPTCPGPNLHGI